MGRARARGPTGAGPGTRAGPGRGRGPWAGQEPGGRGRARDLGTEGGGCGQRRAGAMSEGGGCGRRRAVTGRHGTLARTPHNDPHPTKPTPGPDHPTRHRPPQDGQTPDRQTCPDTPAPQKTKEPGNRGQETRGSIRRPSAEPGTVDGDRIPPKLRSQPDDPRYRGGVGCHGLDRAVTSHQHNVRHPGKPPPHPDPPRGRRPGHTDTRVLTPHSPPPATGHRPPATLKNAHHGPAAATHALPLQQPPAAGRTPRRSRRTPPQPRPHDPKT
ncbi:hypothetical protein ACVWXB_007936 [Streptomyces sp. TE12347]